jgi:methylthioribose-1-phosphate isomerase
MLIDGQHQRTIGLADDGLTVRTLNQRLLPHELVWAELRSLEDASEKDPRRQFP